MEMHSRSNYSAVICCNQLFWFAMLSVVNCEDCTHVLKKTKMGLYSLPEHKWFAALAVSVAVGYAPRTKGLVSKTRLFPASCVKPFVNLAHCTSIILITLPLLPILLLQYININASSVHQCYPYRWHQPVTWGLCATMEQSPGLKVFLSDPDWS